MNTRLQLTCTHCGKELYNGLDTFGDIGDEMCQDCWIHLPEIVDGFALDELYSAELDDQLMAMDFDEPESFYCPKCDDECENDGEWQGVKIYYCWHCDQQYEVTA